MNYLIVTIKTFLHFLILKLARILNLYIGNNRFGFLYRPGDYYLKMSLRNYFYDINKFLNSSTSNTIPSDEQNLIARIIAHYHVLEKGLTMPEPRLGFGTDVAKSLITHLKKYFEKDYDVNHLQIQVAIKVLSDYVYFNMKMADFDTLIISEVNKIKKEYQKNELGSGGIKKITKKEYLQSSRLSFDKMVKARCSVRNFSSEKVSEEIIDKCIEMALRTPSVCNRQSWSTITIFETGMIKKVLQLQNGNRGFGHLINCLIVVKSNLRSFYQYQERNQAFIDSGMFAMSLIYAVQSQGLGAISLNWAVDLNRDIELHNLLEIDDEEIVSMLIGVGHLRDEFSVPYSARKSVYDTNTKWV